MSRKRKQITVFICTRHTLLRDGLKALFANNASNLAVVGEAATGKDAIAQVEQLMPEVVLLDVDLTDLSGFSTMHHILAVDPEVKVLILTLSRNHQGQVLRCMESGAAGHIRRKDGPAQLEAAIVDAASGRRTLRRGVKSAGHMVMGARRA